MRFRWPWRQERTPPDIDAFLAEVSAAQSGRYEPMQRYQDFRRVFLDSQQGRRVLHEILSWGHVYRCPAAMSKFDPHQTMYHSGEANLARRLMATINSEPKARPKDRKELANVQ